DRAVAGVRAVEVHRVVADVELVGRGCSRRGPVEAPREIAAAGWARRAVGELGTHLSHGDVAGDGVEQRAPGRRQVETRAHRVNTGGLGEIQRVAGGGAAFDRGCAHDGGRVVA